MPKTERLFKVLTADGRAHHGGNGRWSLPTLTGPGGWMPPIDKIAPCSRGYHLCREADLIRWLGPMICLAEYRGERKDDDDKIVVSEARLLEIVPTWTEETARLFAADCAERVLKFYEAKYPKDDRPRKAIIAARQYALGLIDAAAWAAAWAAARAAEGAAAGAAAWAAEGAAARAAEGAAAWAAEGAAAWAAEGAAAWDAAGDAARAAERKWQTERLMEYLFAV